MRTVYGNHERFETTYFKKFPGYYCTGDGNDFIQSDSVILHKSTFMNGYFTFIVCVELLISIMNSLLDITLACSQTEVHTKCKSGLKSVNSLLFNNYLFTYNLRS